MPKWTQEQMDAIYKNGSNIIVSAGAGSGKTAVLTERVIEKLKSGIKINELLILTFTNAAAGEMKDRIRKKINEHEELLDNLDYLDSAYITTFDSYTLSLVKKYNYILNVSPNLSIIDAGIVRVKKKEYLDLIIDELYQENNPLFLNLIQDFCIKNDTQIKSAILKIYSALELKSDKLEYLNNYLAEYFNRDKIDAYVKEYLNLIYNELKVIEANLLYISESDHYDYYENLSKSLEGLLKSKTYDEIKENINVSAVRRPRGSEDILSFKQSIDQAVKNIKGYVRFTNTEEIYETFAISKNYVAIIIEIIKKLDNLIMAYKKEYDLYEFTDIELMAINLLKTHPDICQEIKYFYQEICVDEYQDTNDLQEEFIKLIENNNVYMVGDIKQSIYGFRNANPKIFKDKYDNYSKNIGGIKIDLLKNFRSRANVLQGINDIFNLIMDDALGGANYIKSHQMVFGNNNYEEKKCDNQNYDLEIYNYKYEDKVYSKEELEAYTIGRDILKKIKDKYLVIDKESNTLRPCSYEDFCIIMDRGTAFLTYNNIFLYLGIPLQIYEDKILTNEIDLLLINNILGLILKINKGEYDKEFTYYFLSIARSHLYEMPDNLSFEIIKNKTYQDTEIYEKCLRISKLINTHGSYEILKEIIEEFNYYESSIKVGNIEEVIIRINNLYDISKNVSDMGYTIDMFKDYLEEMIKGSSDIKYKSDNIIKNSVKIMNIHKSKGLEFPICYFSGFHKEFNTMDIKERFVYDNTYGIITPFYKDGVGSMILKDLLKNKYYLDNISEQIRLFYVALTRAKEKMIIVTSLADEEHSTKRVVDYNIRCKYNSFLSMLNSINGNLHKYITNVVLEDLDMTKNYYVKKEVKLEFKSDVKNTIKYHDLVIDNEIVKKQHASKEVGKIITNDEFELLGYGTKIHNMLLETDLLNINHNHEYKSIINNLVELLGITNKTKIIKEHEFMYTVDNVVVHGIIDLVLIEGDLVKIVDYKLKDISDAKYIEQVKVYYNYLVGIYPEKVIECYLYSIINNELKLVYSSIDKVGVNS